MRYPVRSAVLIAAVMFAAACTQSETPTGPSEVSPLNDRGAVSSSQSWGTMSQSRQSQVVDWSCLTTGAGCSVLALPSRISQGASPNAPPNLAYSVSGSTVVLTWSPPGPGPTVDTYVLEAGTAPGLSNLVSFNTGSTATTFTATDVPAGTYYGRVRAANVDGLGAASNEVMIVVACTPSAPPTLSGSASGSTVTLTWSTVSGAMGFIIEAGSTPGASNITSFDTGSAATSFTKNDVPDGTYYVRARVRTSCGTSGVSNEVAVTVGTSFSGLWQGTISPTLSGTVQVDVTHDGTSLRGTVRSRPAGRAIIFKLTQRGSAPFDPRYTSVYDGDLRFEGTAAACNSPYTVWAQAGVVNVYIGVNTGLLHIYGDFIGYPPIVPVPNFLSGGGGTAAEACPSLQNRMILTKQ